ncbi:MAG TPA: phospholipase D-like domain-containing protein, partial [Pyrinomonadaceae bacterium]|nr:phospholipase D-like domain-containing protein [Pyrinomonadaceae bacterium]
MLRTRCFVLTFWVIVLFCLLTPQSTSAQERLCDPSFEDCYSPLLQLINSETVGIDMSFYMIELPGLADAVIARYKAGVPVRLVVEPRGDVKFPMNQPILDKFQAAGIPMRYKLGDGIIHVKLLLCSGQNKVVFTGSNFGDADVAPYDPYVNYVDGAWYFTDDASVVNSFKTRYDDVWTDTATYGNYANISTALTRKYPTFPIDPAVNFLPNKNLAEDYGARTIALIDKETQKIDVTMYRLTDTTVCDAVLRAVARGVPVRLLTEPDEYRFDASRLGAEFTGPYNVDRLYAAGVQVRMRKHLGLNHQKTVSLYGQGITIFGSSNWSWESYNYQEEHNYFTTKTWFFQWFVNQFNRKWISTTEYEDFVPLPPSAPNYLSPGNATTVGTSVMLNWEGGGWAHKYDVYLGTNANSLNL